MSLSYLHLPYRRTGSLSRGGAPRFRSWASSTATSFGAILDDTPHPSRSCRANSQRCRMDKFTIMRAFAQHSSRYQTCPNMSPTAYTFRNTQGMPSERHSPEQHLTDWDSTPSPGDWESYASNCHARSLVCGSPHWHPTATRTNQWTCYK